MEKKFIVITSIFSPTEAVKKFANIDGWHLIVVGDKKSPSDWKLPNVTFLGPEDQLKLGYEILDKLPWNHYCRKMVGYLYAIEQGADLIAESDDDNIPYDSWPELPDSIAMPKLISGSKFVNIYKFFTNEPVWPRGYPLNRILESEDTIQKEGSDKVGIWQFLADEDPDVDAIYRLTNNKPIYFSRENISFLALDKGTVSPFNSQNTIFTKELFPLLYLPSYVTFRFTDILRGLVAQPLMWTTDMRLGIGPATVIQKRNPHDYLRDFESEIPVFLHSEKVIDILSSLNLEGEQLADALLIAYEELLKEEIVKPEETELVSRWVNDIKRLSI